MPSSTFNDIAASGGAACTTDTPCGQGDCCGCGFAAAPDGKGGAAREQALKEAVMAKEVKDQEALKKDVMARMKRIEGQVRGIQRMIEEGKECEDILVQVRAVRSALRSATTQIMRRYLLRCNEQAMKTGDPNVQYEKLMKLVSDFIDG